MMQAALPISSERCRICGADGARESSLHFLGKMLDSAEVFKDNRCRRCGFGWLTPRPTEKELDALYGEKYFAAYSGASSNTTQDLPALTILDRLRIKLAWTTDRGIDQVNEIERLMGSGSDNPSVCDIGCGNGDLLVRLKKAGRTLVGVEPDAAARERCRASGIEVHSGRIEILPQEIAANSQDVVIMSHVLEHCHEPMQALTNAARVLNQTGILVVEVPNAASFGSKYYGTSWYHADYGRHMNFFNERSLTLAMEKVGLTRVRVSYSQYVNQFKNEWISAQQNAFDKQRQLGEIVPNALRDSKARSWKLLLKTLLAGPASRYTCMRMIAQKSLR